MCAAIRWGGWYDRMDRNGRKGYFRGLRRIDGRERLTRREERFSVVNCCCCCCRARCRVLRLFWEETRVGRQFKKMSLAREIGKRGMEICLLRANYLDGGILHRRTIVERFSSCSAYWKRLMFEKANAVFWINVTGGYKIWETNDREDLCISEFQ